MKERIGNIAPFGLRMPVDVRSWVEAKANEIDRSMNYVVIAILRERMKSSGATTTAGAGLAAKSAAPGDNQFRAASEGVTP